jgi:hypothetical protein
LFMSIHAMVAAVSGRWSLLFLAGSTGLSVLLSLCRWLLLLLLMPLTSFLPDVVVVVVALTSRVESSLRKL